MAKNGPSVRRKILAKLPHGGYYDCSNSSGPIGLIGGSNSGRKASGWMTESMLLEDEELIAAIGLDALKRHGQTQR